MKVYVCLTYFDEEHPNNGTIQRIYSKKEDADEWRDKNQGPYYEVHEWEVE